MQDTSNLDKPKPLDSFNLQSNFEAVLFWVNMEPLQDVHSKNFIMSTEFTYELLTYVGKAFHTNRDHWTPYYPKNFWFFNILIFTMNKIL